LTASQSQQFSAASTGIGGAGAPSVTWSINPASGSISSNGLYTAPSSISSQQTVIVTASGGGSSATASITLTPTQTQPPSPTSITLPLEVIGPNGTTVSASFAVGSGANLNGNTTLSMQIHGLRFDQQASVQVNGSSWLPISNSTVAVQGLGANYGGIGGGYSTVQMTMALTSGVVTTGTNTITFKFNGTDGRVSGFRVLGFNIQDASGNQLIPSSSFVWDDPNSWQPPSSAASDIAAGQSLWRTASLTTPTGSGTQSIQAHCADCHPQDGRDLKYFNYSNNSIHTRSVFHGLTAQQGDQIASYIRSLNVPNPGRPWNPPYQPGPGLDSQPVANWAAGAGLSAVLDSDAAMLPYLMPGGSSAGWAASAYLNPRELPIAMQLPDWNSWLPGVHPMDAYGASFTGSQYNAMYSKIRGELQPNSATAYQGAVLDFGVWNTASANFLAPIENAANFAAPGVSAALFSAKLWMMVKLWEINQEFGLEGMPQVPFVANADARGWASIDMFFASPIQLKIPVGPGIGNGSQAAWMAIGHEWYQMQMILNDGQGQQVDHEPIDYGYATAHIKDMATATNTAQSNLMTEWLIKSLQEFAQNGNGPEFGVFGFAPTASLPLPLVAGSYATIWQAVSPSTELNVTTAYLQNWFAKVSSYTPQEYYQGVDGNGRPWAAPTENPATDVLTTQFGGEVWYVLPRLRFLGVNSGLLNQIYSWAATVWPAGSWSLNSTATCSSFVSCSSDN
jgi:hypothetical protein